VFSNRVARWFGFKPKIPILEGLGKENVVIFYDHSEYFSVIWYNLWPFGIVCGHFVYFFPFWYVWTKKNLATLFSSAGEKKTSWKIENE
jgi:hypothetical protein